MGRTLEEVKRYFVRETDGLNKPKLWGTMGPGAWSDTSSKDKHGEEREPSQESVFSPNRSNYITACDYLPGKRPHPPTCEVLSSQKWEILGYQRLAQNERRRAAWIGTAHRIVLEGFTEAMNKTGGAFPVYRLNPSAKNQYDTLYCDYIDGPVESYGGLRAILREDLENFNVIRNMLRSYHRAWTRQAVDKPLSIAVFGPPGSGKSFAVGEIAKSISPDQIVQLPFNIAQFDSAEQIVSALIEVRDANLDGKLPLVFFDEFDSSMTTPGDRGWLKYFLAPMEDGKFLMPEKGMLRVGRAIFVFAGGTAERYRDFIKYEPRSTPPKRLSRFTFGRPPQCGMGGALPTSQTRPFSAQFRDAKGPDFISRLRGHIDIPGINLTPAQINDLREGCDGDCDDEDIRPYLQRAVVMRSMLEGRGMTVRKRAMIDERVVAAMLRVDRYLHGTRSMGALLDMCKPVNGRRIHPVNVPEALLQMHIGDVKNFMKQLDQPKYRVTRPW